MIYFFLFYVYECFASMYIGPAVHYLFPEEARENIDLLELGYSDDPFCWCWDQIFIL